MASHKFWHFLTLPVDSKISMNSTVVAALARGRASRASPTIAVAQLIGLFRGSQLIVLSGVCLTCARQGITGVTHHRRISDHGRRRRRRRTRSTANRRRSANPSGGCGGAAGGGGHGGGVVVVSEVGIRADRQHRPRAVRKMVFFCEVSLRLSEPVLVR